MELSHKEIREQRELETLFKNPKHARTTWQEVVYARYTMPAMKPIPLYDKDGNQTQTSCIECHLYEYLQTELGRMPMEGELMEACQSYYARHNAAAYVARRDSMGAKPIDETKISASVNSPFEGLTDEELLVMQNALDNLHKEDKVDG